MPNDVRRKVTFVQSDGENAAAAALCHGVLDYLDTLRRWSTNCAGA